MCAKRILCVFICTALLLTAIPFGVSAEYVASEEIPSEFLCDYATGTVLFEKNADERRHLASVTKIMTMLLVLESADRGDISLDDEVTVSAYSSGMGGSQVYLKEGEVFPVRELLKCVAVVSANDACVALAEYVCGSEQTFVDRMNQRAEELGMTNTHFENTNGLDDTATEHYSSARDIATMSRELMKHSEIFEYTTVWTDSFRNGEFGLTNTNKLIRFYNGANGLKTGSTSKALYCISATAKKEDTQLIAVIMGAPTSDKRNAEAKQLLDYGFAGYANVHYDKDTLECFPVIRGTQQSCTLVCGECDILCAKSEKDNIQIEVSLPEYITAPLAKGSKVGEITYIVDGEEVGKSEITVESDINEITYLGLLEKTLRKFLAV